MAQSVLELMFNHWPPTPEDLLELIPPSLIHADASVPSGASIGDRDPLEGVRLVESITRLFPETQFAARWHVKDPETGRAYTLTVDVKGCMVENTYNVSIGRLAT